MQNAVYQSIECKLFEVRSRRNADSAIRLTNIRIALNASFHPSYSHRTHFPFAHSRNESASLTRLDHGPLSPLHHSDCRWSGIRRQVRRIGFVHVGWSASWASGHIWCVPLSMTWVLHMSPYWLERTITTEELLKDSATLWTKNFPTNYTDLSQAPIWCSFYGVTCGADPSDVQYRRTIAVDIGYLRLDGTLPELGRLQEMTYFDVSVNSIVGTVPNAISKLTSLQVLYLSFNKLQGTIPSIIGSLTRLNSLQLDSNHLTGTIPSAIGSLTKLAFLDFTKCKLRGTIPTTFGGLANLEYLNLAVNSLSGTIPSSLAKLPKLAAIHLYLNRLTGTIPCQFSRLTTMQLLNLDENLLTGTIPSCIGTFSLLEILNLHKNSLTGKIPNSIGQCTKLIYLELDQNSFTGTIPSSFGGLINLQKLRLERNSLRGTIPVLINPKLTFVYLHSNYLTMGSLSDVPLSTFSAAALSGKHLLLENNCLAFENPNNPSHNVNINPMNCKCKYMKYVIWYYEMRNIVRWNAYYSYARN